MGARPPEICEFSKPKQNFNKKNTPSWLFTSRSKIYEFRERRAFCLGYLLWKRVPILKERANRKKLRARPNQSDTRRKQHCFCFNIFPLSSPEEYPDYLPKRRQRLGLQGWYNRGPSTVFQWKYRVISRKRVSAGFRFKSASSVLPIVPSRTGSVHPRAREHQRKRHTSRQPYADFVVESI